MGKRNEGARLLARVGLGQTEIAAELGVSQVAVSYWLSGTKLPARARREAIAKRFGVPADAWDAPPMKAPKAPVEAAAPTIVTSATGDDAEIRLREQLARLDQLRREDPHMPPQSRLRLEATETKCIGLLRRMTSAGDEISEARVLRLPAWRRIQEAMVLALRPWPAAAGAVERALRGLSE